MKTALLMLLFVATASPVLGDLPGVSLRLLRAKPSGLM